MTKLFDQRNACDCYRGDGPLDISHGPLNVIGASRSGVAGSASWSPVAFLNFKFNLLFLICLNSLKRHKWAKAFAYRK